jgi:hypothetical protein
MFDKTVAEESKGEKKVHQHVNIMYIDDTKLYPWVRTKLNGLVP